MRKILDIYCSHRKKKCNYVWSMDITTLLIWDQTTYDFFFLKHGVEVSFFAYGGLVSPTFPSFTVRKFKKKLNLMFFGTFIENYRGIKQVTIAYGNFFVGQCNALGPCMSQKNQTINYYTYYTTQTKSVCYMQLA